MSDKFFNKLQAYRLRANLSQRELEKLSGVTASSICAIELGKRRVQSGTKFALSKALKISVEQLFPTGMITVTKGELLGSVRRFKQSQLFINKLKRRPVEEVLDGFVDFIFGVV